ncbi:MAG: hypothetical protein HKL96_13245 [Phycisphaerales bacterium]|nr:hypothetical protein [Phycisphaerales bacterium]
MKNTFQAPAISERRVNRINPRSSYHRLCCRAGQSQRHAAFPCPGENKNHPCRNKRQASGHTVRAKQYTAPSIPRQKVFNKKMSQNPMLLLR